MSASPQLPSGNEQILQELATKLQQLGITQKYGLATINSLFFNPQNPKAVNNAVLLEAALLGSVLPKEFLVSQAFAPPTAEEEIQIQRRGFTGLGAKALRLSTAPGVSLQAWYVKPEPGKETILFSNGTDGDFLKSRELMAELKEEGYGILTYQFRGYGAAQGGSTGTPSEEGFYSDLEALSRFLAQGSAKDGIAQTPYDKQILMGYSLGGDVSAHVASESMEHYKALVLINTPRSIEDAFKAQIADTDSLVREITAPFQFGIRDTANKLDGVFDIADEIAQMRTPTLYVQGGQDKLALPEIERELFNSQTFPVKSFFSIPDADHGTTISEQNNADAIGDKVDSFISGLDYNRVVQDMAGYCDRHEGVPSFQFSQQAASGQEQLAMLFAGQIPA